MQLPIACRYVPYDQWFLTHIDPTWKIKHLKQRIISKCLNLPFDPRFKDVARNGRPPSPITFAPASARPASPVGYAVPDSETSSDHQESTGEGYEDDDEWDQVPNIKFNVKSKPSSFRPHRQQKQDQEPQITTHTYTLFRFSTCQILEEDCQVSWYDIQPHELVELHSSFLPPTFASSLVSPMSIPSLPTDSVALTQTKSAQKKKASPITLTDQKGDLPIPSLTALLRHTPTLYIQPYWQGWVRALRVVSRIQTTPASDEPPHPSLGDDDREGNGDRKHGERIEWRERWVVIHDGVINICKSLNDTNPTRIPLSSLMALRGSEYLPHSKNGTSKPRSTTRSPDPSTSTSMTSEDLLKEAMESVPDKEKRTTRSLKKTRKDELLSTASSPSLRSLGQDRQLQRISSYIPTPITYNSKSKSFLPLKAEDHERDREKVLEREKSREKLEREAQYSKKWDDHLGFSITLGGKDKSKNKERDSSKSLREDRSNTFIPSSREEAEQAGMKIICIKFRVHPAAAGEGDKAVGQDGAFPKTRRYTSTGPSLALIAGAGGMKLKVKTSSGPHVVIDSGVNIGEPPLKDFEGISVGSSRSTATTAGTDSITTSPILHPTGFAWNLFGGVKADDKERKTTEGRKVANDDHGSLPPQSTAAEDFEVPTTVSSVGWKFVSPPRLEKGTGSRSTEFGAEVDEAGYAVIIPERSDSISSSLPTTARPTVVVPVRTPTLVTTATATSPKSQPEHETHNQANDNSHSDSSSSISVSSPVFAHSPNESDLDDESFGLGGGAARAMSGVSCKPRKGYRYSGYVQAQMKKAKNEGRGERLVIGDRRGVTKAAETEVNSKLGDGDQPQQARREGKERNKDEECEGWIALDMVNDNAFNSILRILHRHSPPYLSSSFTHSHTIINSPNIFYKDLHHGSKVPSDIDDDGQYAATAKNPGCYPATDGTSHSPIFGPLAARAATAQQLAYVALPYPEWRLNLMNQARRAGMREIGRPLDLALHGWGREFEEAAARERKSHRELAREKKNRRKSEQSHVSTIKARGRRVGRVAGGSDADDDDDEDEDEAVGTTQLDSDSDEEESDTEWLAWMTDLPRQFLVQQSQMTARSSSTSQFSNPFSSSPLVEGDEPIRSPRTQEEERTFQADRMRYFEPSSTVRANPPYLPSPMFFDPSKQLSSHSSYESLNQRSSSSRNSTPFPGLSTDDLLVNKGNHSRSQSRSLQHLGSYRHVGSVPEEDGDGYNPTAISSPQKHGLHHSVSVDQHLSSRRKEVDSHRRNDSTTSNENQFALGKPILTNEQILQIESEVFASAANTSLPLHWTFPPIPVPSPPPPPSSPSTSASKARLPAVVSTNDSGEVKASSSMSGINRFTPSDHTRWSTSFGSSLSTPSSPSASTNSTSPPRTSMLGSLGRSPSLLGKMGGQEKEKKGFLRKRMSRDLAKDKEKDKDRDTGERAISPAGASPKQRPKLLLAGLSSSTSYSMPLPNHPEIPFSAQNSNLGSGHQLYQSVSAISSSARALRRVHSGTSIRGEEGSTTPAAGLEVMSPPESEGNVKEVQKKKKGPIDMIVRGFDSSLAFAEGR